VIYEQAAKTIGTEPTNLVFNELKRIRGN